MIPEGTVGKQAAKSAAAQERICQAAIRCLAEIGYAATSINRVVERAAVSKGALQHHFPTKEDLMAATAQRILANATLFHVTKAKGAKAKRSTATELLNTWEKVVNTDEFRALLEILITMRTDQALKERLSPALRQWHQQRIALAVTAYESPPGSDGDVELLITMNSCLMRGLVIQDQYTEDPAEILRVLQRWVEIVSPLLVPREPE